MGGSRGFPPLCECDSVVTAVVAVMLLPSRGHTGHSRYGCSGPFPPDAGQCSLESPVLCSLPQQTLQKFNTPLEICRTPGFIQVSWSQHLMVGWTMVLSKVVSPIFISRCPTCFKLSLFCSVLEPTEPHVNCFASLLFDSSIHDAIESTVVGLHWCGPLGVAQLL